MTRRILVLYYLVFHIFWEVPFLLRLIAQRNFLSLFKHLSAVNSLSNRILHFLGLFRLLINLIGLISLLVLRLVDDATILDTKIIFQLFFLPFMGLFELLLEMLVWRVCFEDICSGIVIWWYATQVSCLSATGMCGEESISRTGNDVVISVRLLEFTYYFTPLNPIKSVNFVISESLAWFIAFYLASIHTVILFDGWWC